jgi:DNA-binding protein HU-beta
MTKKELIEAVSTHCCSKAEAEKVINAFFEEIEKTLSKGKDVSIASFGSFKVKKRAARKGRNPKTGEEIQIQAQKVVGFKASSVLKAKVKK